MIASVIKKLVQSSRLNEYEEILKCAIDNGYRITSLIDWYHNRFYPDQKVFVLRHDVDYDNEGAFKMYEIEKKLGVLSTFYYRHSTIDNESMHTMHEDGFEVSFHFETLATFCREKNIKDGTELTDDDFDEAYKRLVKEIKRFEKDFWKIKTICSHGDQRNRLIGIPNHALLKGRDLSELGIHFETYDEHIISKFDCYISDSSIKKNHEWRYGISPLQAIKRGDTSICLLTHPQHWNYHFRRNICKVMIDIKEYLIRK